MNTIYANFYAHISKDGEEDVVNSTKVKVKFSNFLEYEYDVKLYLDVEDEEIEWEDLFFWRLDDSIFNAKRGRNKGKMKEGRDVKFQSKVKKKNQVDNEGRSMKKKHRIFKCSWNISLTPGV